MVPRVKEWETMGLLSKNIYSIDAEEFLPGNDNRKKTLDRCLHLLTYESQMGPVYNLSTSLQPINLKSRQEVQLDNECKDV